MIGGVCRKFFTLHFLSIVLTGVLAGCTTTFEKTSLKLLIWSSGILEAMKVKVVLFKFTVSIYAVMFLITSPEILTLSFSFFLCY